MREFERRIPVNHDKYTDIDIYITYNKGDNYRTRRGYYVYVHPIATKVIGGYEYVSSVPSEGYRFLAQEVTRKSNKALKEVTDNLKRYAQPMINAVCDNLCIPLVTIDN